MICIRVVFVLSKTCPKCEIFKYGSLVRFDYKNKNIERIYSDDSDGKSGLSIIKNICQAVGIPFTELDVGVEPDIPSIPILTKGGIVESRLGINPNRFWLGYVIGKSTVELPGVLIKSNTAKDRYINLEIITEAPKDAPKAMIISQWVAVRQCLRNMARTAIEEKLIMYHGNIDFNLREYILNKLFPMREEGDEEPNEWKWIEGFIKLRRLKIK